MAYSDSGLPGILFSLLDYEEGAQVIKHAQETITSVLMEMAADNLLDWLSHCKKILTVNVGSPGGLGRGLYRLDGRGALGKDKEAEVVCAGLSATILCMITRPPRPRCWWLCPMSSRPSSRLRAFLTRSLASRLVQFSTSTLGVEMINVLLSSPGTSPSPCPNKPQRYTKS